MDTFLLHTAQLQECRCCSFIFFKTASFSTLTRFLHSSSLRPSQNSLVRSLSLVEDMLQILLFSADWVLARPERFAPACVCWRHLRKAARERLNEPPETNPSTYYQVPCHVRSKGHLLARSRIQSFGGLVPKAKASG